MRERVRPSAENRADAGSSETGESRAKAVVDGGDGDVGDGGSGAAGGSAESRISWRRAEANSSGRSRNRRRSVAAGW